MPIRRALVTLGLRLFPVPTTKLIIWWFARKGQPRPRRWSMAHPYTSWLGLTDLRYTGRHLPEDKHWDQRIQNGAWPGLGRGATHQNTNHARAARKYGPRLDPSDTNDLQTLKNLFLRPQGATEKACERTSVLFLFFAQWFTDAFLRTDWRDARRTDSNHEIDFCALYGLTEEKTNLLRFPLYDAQGERVVDVNGIPQVDPNRAHLMAFQLINGEEYPPYLFDQTVFSGSSSTLRYHRDFTYQVDVPQEAALGVAGPRPVTRVTRYLHDLDHMTRITMRQNPNEVSHYFAMGLEHGNGTLGYVALNIMMLRAHNKMAREILAAHGADWGPGAEERAFQTTRNVLTFILLKIVIEDYVTHIADWKLKTPVGMSDGANWGKANRIAIEFNLLYRWHSLVPDNILVNGQPLDPSLFRRRPDLVPARGLETLLTSFSRQHAGRMALRNYPHFFSVSRGGGMLSTLEQTLKINFEAKLAPMNAYRRHFGLAPYSSIEALVGDQPEADVLVAELKRIYGHIDDVEWFIGMLAENHGGDGSPVIMGQLMMTMVAHDAFTQALNNPLLSKRLHDPLTGGKTPVFSKQGLEIINRISSLQELSDYVFGPNQARCSFSV